MKVSFVRQVAALASGTIVAQVITLGFSVVLARIFSGEDFGYFSAFVGVLSILAIVATGSYDKALMFARSRRRMASVVVLVLWLGLGLAGIVSIFGLACFLLDVRLPYGFSHFDLIALLPIGIVATISSQLAVYALLKSDNARAIAVAKVIQASVGGGAQTSGAVIDSPKCLVIGYLVGLLTFTPYLWRKLSHLFVSRWRSLRRAAIASAIKFRRYPLYVCPNELLDVVSHQVPLLLIAWFFSLATLGQYGFAQRILAGPTALIGQAVGQVFFKRISHDQLSSRDTRGLIFLVWSFMGALGALPFLALFLFGEDIFVVVFGAEWGEAGRISELISPILFFRFVSSPTSSIYYRLNLQRAQLLFVMSAFLVRTGPFLFAIHGMGFNELIVIQVIGEILIILAYNTLALARLGRHD